MSMFHDHFDTPMDLSVKTRRKLRLEEFLRQNLDHAPADRVIQWVDREQGVFRILWTHQSSGAFTQEDAALFRYWALARGKPANLSSVELKQSLRMALNKSPSVERVPATHDEYRYFRFTDWGSRRSEQRTSNHHHLDPETYESGYSAFHRTSSPTRLSSFKSESDVPIDDRYHLYSCQDDLYSRDSLLNGSPSDSSSLSSYSMSPTIPSEIFQVSDDPYNGYGATGHYQKHQRLNYNRGSPEPCRVSRDHASMELAYSVPSAANLLSKEDMKSYQSLYDDTLYRSASRHHNFLSPTALLALNNNYGLLHDSLTIDRRKPNLLP